MEKVKNNRGEVKKDGKKSEELEKRQKQKKSDRNEAKEHKMGEKRCKQIDEDNER